LRSVRHPSTGELLDRAILLFFPGPYSATGEDLGELHLHGGRSVVAAVLDALGAIDGLRSAKPGEFTRRAFDNGRLDLAEAEGFADLLAAETQSQRRAALALAGGALSRRVEDWQSQLLQLAAGVESLLDFSDEGDVADDLPESWTASLQELLAELDGALRSPHAERLRDGVRVVIAGPPNAGKSSLLNWLAGRRAAITSAIAGTTRDLIEAPTAIEGAPFLLVDTAGLRDGADEIEAEGVALARESLAAADLVLWLGKPENRPDPARSIVVASKADLYPPEQRPSADIHVSAETGEGMDALIALLVGRARALLPAEGEVAVNKRHRDALGECVSDLRMAGNSPDHLLVAEHLRLACGALDRITGRAGVEDMLDRLFGSFCIGK
jgi:tRNA modification GTPase